MNPRRLVLPMTIAGIYLALVGVFAAVAMGQTTPPPVTPVAQVDPARYAGTWRQIAAIPAPYEAFCLKDVTATYTVNPDGTIKVFNRCKGPFDFNIDIVGKARPLDATVARLQVSFFEFFGKQIYADETTPNYVIAGLAPDYSWAVVGDPARRSGFVLARDVTLSPQATADARAALVASGYDPCVLKTTVQTGGATESKPFC